MQLSVVMRPLPHSFSLAHNKSATPAFGFYASPAVGSWRKLGGSTPSPLKCPSLQIREQELPSEGAVKRTQLLLATPLHSPTFPHHPAKPGLPLGQGIGVLRCYATGLGSQGPGAHNCNLVCEAWRLHKHYVTPNYHKAVLCPLLALRMRALDKKNEKQMGGDSIDRCVFNSPSVCVDWARDRSI